MLEYGFPLNHIFQHKAELKFVLVQENTYQRKPVIWHTLRSKDKFLQLQVRVAIFVLCFVAGSQKLVLLSIYFKKIF